MVWLLLSPPNTCSLGVARAVIMYVSSLVVWYLSGLVAVCLAVDGEHLVLQEVINGLSLVYTVLSYPLHTWATPGVAPLAQFEATVGGADTLLHAWCCKATRSHM